MTMTKRWQFPEWKDMKPIDISKPLVTRDGEVVTAKYNGDEQQWYPYDVFNSENNAMWTVTDKGLELEYEADTSSARDVQNPPEWAYGQFSIEPPKESARLNAADEAKVDEKRRVFALPSGDTIWEYDPESRATTIHTDTIRKLAAKPCLSPGVDYLGNSCPCGYCVACLYRAAGGDILTDKQALIEEQQRLEAGATKLSEFIGLGPLFETLHHSEQELLKEQCEIMWQYYEILGKRIALP